MDAGCVKRHPDPPPGMHSYVFINGLRFHYLDWGGDGPPLVLLHGLASNAHIWDRVAPLLARRFRVVALDQRNHGLTDPAEDGFDFAAITADLLAFINTLNLERPLLVGHSWGAGTVLHYAAARPALGIVMVDGGLVRLNDLPGMTWEIAEKMLQPPELDGMEVEAFLERMRGMLKDRYSDDVGRMVLTNFRIDEDDRIHRRLPVARHMQVARAIYESPTDELFARLRCPALLCPALEPPPHDERTAQFIELKRQAAARAEQANERVRTVWFVDSPHDIPVFQPEALAGAIIDFGSGLSA